MNATAHLGRTAGTCALLTALAGLGYLIFLGYLTPEMMVYFLAFQWCL